jgi:hypothetical protein
MLQGALGGRGERGVVFVDRAQVRVAERAARFGLGSASRSFGEKVRIRRCRTAAADAAGSRE